MKKDTHPEYHEDATVTCACGNKIKVGSTQEKIDVEICSNCHPFYTGDDQLLDTAGRAEKFEKRRKSAKEKEKAKKGKKKKSSKSKEKEDKTEKEKMIEKAKEKLNS